MRYNNSSILIATRGFALIEVLIAVAILSVVLLSVYSGISSGINIISNSRNYTKSMIIAKSLMNEFRNDNMRGTDIHDSPVDDHEGFTYDRITERYELELAGPIGLNKTEITVKWIYKGKSSKYNLSMVYQAK